MLEHVIEGGAHVK